MGWQWRYTSRVVGLVLLALVFVLVLAQERIGVWETSLAGQLATFVAEPQIGTVDNVIYFGIGTEHGYAVQVTSECSAVVLVAPLVVIAAFILWLGRFSIRSVLYALSISMASLVMLNQARFLLIIGSMSKWGYEGYEITHRYLGTVLTVFGATCAIALLLYQVSRLNPRWRMKKKRVTAPTR